MSKAWLRVVFGLLACFLLVGTGFAQTEQTQEGTTDQPMGAEGTSATTTTADQTAPETVRGELPPPLATEMVIAEHFSRNPYPRTIPAGSRLHIVAKGDTLWDIAGLYYNNPLLWPQLWEANSYIPNAHWIYPGDPVVIPPLTPISDEQIAQETSGEPSTGPDDDQGEAVGLSIPRQEKQPVPIAIDFDLYCSGYITDFDIDNTPLRVAGNEENIDKVSLSLFDIVYLNQGEAQGISPGDEFTIVQRVRSIEHPVTLEPLGEYVIQTGRLKVVATQENTSTAQITYSCDATLVGDALLPFKPREVPMMTDMPPVDRFSLEGPNPKGYVIFAKDDLQSLGVGNELQIDLGSQDGIQVGSRLILYRPNVNSYEETGFDKDLPRRVLGEVIVFNVQEGTATGRIIQSYDYVKIGDRVEIR